RLIDNEKILGISLYHHFTKIIINEKIINLPNAATHLYFSFKFVTTINITIDYNIPSSVTHIFYGHGKVFGPRHRPTYIERSLTTLFGNNIPSSVTHLVLNTYVEFDTVDCVPSSITHLTLDDSFCAVPVSHAIHSNIKELMIGNFCDSELYHMNIFNIPKHVNIIFCDD